MTPQIEKVKAKIKANKKKIEDLEDELHEFSRYEDIEWEIYVKNNENDKLAEKLKKLKAKAKK